MQRTGLFKRTDFLQTGPFQGEEQVHGTHSKRDGRAARAPAGAARRMSVHGRPEALIPTRAARRPAR